MYHKYHENIPNQSLYFYYNQILKLPCKVVLIISTTFNGAKNGTSTLSIIEESNSMNQSIKNIIYYNIISST